MGRLWMTCGWLSVVAARLDIGGPEAAFCMLCLVFAGRASCRTGLLAGGAGLRDGSRLGIFGVLARIGLPAIPSTSLRAITPRQGAPSANVALARISRGPLIR